MVLVHGLLVILDSRRFSSVEVRRCVGIYTMGELKLMGFVEIHRQVVRRQLARGTPANKEIIICAHQFSSGEGAIHEHLTFLLPHRLPCRCSDGGPFRLEKSPQQRW